MKNSHPGTVRASVIMAARNVERTVGRAILSATAQSLREIEVIVVDDGSSDATASIVASLAQADPRIRLIRHPRSLGVSAARNAAVAEAQGEWLAVLDADDWFAPDRLATLVQSGEERDLDAVIDNLQRVDSSNGAPHWPRLSS